MSTTGRAALAAMCVAVGGVASVGLGCGADPEPPRAPAESSTTGSTGGTSTGSGAAPNGGETTPKPPPIEGEERFPPGTRPRTLPDGSIAYRSPGGGAIIKEPVTKRRSARPKGGCGRYSGEPPRPGLRAKLVGRAVRFYYDFGDVPGACRPESVFLTFSTSLGPEAPNVDQRRIAETKGVIEVAIPDWWRSLPQQAGASGRRGEQSGDGVKVRIAE